MRMRRNRLGLIALMLLLIFALTTTGFVWTNPAANQLGGELIALHNS